MGQNDGANWASRLKSILKTNSKTLPAGPKSGLGQSAQELMGKITPQWALGGAVSFIAAFTLWAVTVPPTSEPSMGTLQSGDRFPDSPNLTDEVEGGGLRRKIWNSTSFVRGIVKPGAPQDAKTTSDPMDEPPPFEMPTLEDGTDAPAQALDKPAMAFLNSLENGGAGSSSSAGKTELAKVSGSASPARSTLSSSAGIGPAGPVPARAARSNSRRTGSALGPGGSAPTQVAQAARELRAQSGKSAGGEADKNKDYSPAGAKNQAEETKVVETEKKKSVGGMVGKKDDDKKEEEDTQEQQQQQAEDPPQDTGRRVCPQGTTDNGAGQCIPDCPRGETFDMNAGQCRGINATAAVEECPVGSVPQIITDAGQQYEGCVICAAPNRIEGGQCLAPPEPPSCVPGMDPGCQKCPAGSVLRIISDAGQQGCVAQPPSCVPGVDPGCPLTPDQKCKQGGGVYDGTNCNQAITCQYGWDASAWRCSSAPVPETKPWWQAVVETAKIVTTPAAAAAVATAQAITTAATGTWDFITKTIPATTANVVATIGQGIAKVVAPVVKVVDAVVETVSKPIKAAVDWGAAMVKKTIDAGKAVGTFVKQGVDKTVEVVKNVAETAYDAAASRVSAAGKCKLGWGYPACMAKAALFGEPKPVQTVKKELVMPEAPVTLQKSYKDARGNRGILQPIPNAKPGQGIPQPMPFPKPEKSTPGTCSGAWKFIKPECWKKAEPQGGENFKVNTQLGAIDVKKTCPWNQFIVIKNGVPTCQSKASSNIYKENTNKSGGSKYIATRCGSDEEAVAFTKSQDSRLVAGDSRAKYCKKKKTSTPVSSLGSWGSGSLYQPAPKKTPQPQKPAYGPPTKSQWQAEQAKKVSTTLYGKAKTTIQKATKYSATAIKQKSEEKFKQKYAIKETAKPKLAPKQTLGSTIKSLFKPKPKPAPKPKAKKKNWWSF